MRLFIAVVFSQEVLRRILVIQKEIQQKAIGGNFTREENLHLTLAFLGEVGDSHLQTIEKVMDRAIDSPFLLEFDKIGTFKRGTGELYYLGSKPEKILSDLAHDLRASLQKQGFSVDNKPFTPHLTLGREVIVQKRDRICFDPIIAPAYKVCLMKSERIKGELQYTSIYEKSFRREMK